MAAQDLVSCSPPTAIAGHIKSRRVQHKRRSVVSARQSFTRSRHHGDRSRPAARGVGDWRRRLERAGRWRRTARL